MPQALRSAIRLTKMIEAGFPVLGWTGDHSLIGTDLKLSASKSLRFRYQFGRNANTKNLNSTIRKASVIKHTRWRQCHGNALFVAEFQHTPAKQQQGRGRPSPAR